MTEYQQKWRQGILGVYWVLALYHTVRDVLQLYEVNIFFTTIAKRNHEWCRTGINYCDFVTFPLELFVLVAIPIIWGRSRMGMLDFLVLLAPLLLLIMWLLP